MKGLKLYLLAILMLAFFSVGLAQRPYRVGTSTANFLEVGFGSAGVAMGDAYVSAVHDISSVFWNPAGLGFMDSNEAMFVIQPWLLETSTSFVAVGVPLHNIGTLALSIIHMGYGEMEVTTLRQQDGTGELFDANELAATLSYGRPITDWFSFGAGVKYVSSQIWHETASAIAFDLGVQVKTNFFSFLNSQHRGMKMGMSISNYGTKMSYNGLDLLNPIDILPNENGNYKDVPGQFRLREWELPLIFRVGVAIVPLAVENHQITVAVDALHPNNNSESINAGLEYQVTMPAFGDLFLRCGYKGLFMVDSEYGPTFGAGFSMNLLRNIAMKFDYAYRNIGVLGSANSFGFSFKF